MKVEELAGDLKKLVGYGADPKRLAVSPLLRELVGVNGQPMHIAGYMVRTYLQEKIASLNTAHPVDGRYIPSTKLKHALTLLFQLDGRREWAEVRRYEVIELFEINCSTTKWRKPVGPEMELMLILARHMLQTPSLTNNQPSQEPSSP